MFPIALDSSIVDLAAGLREWLVRGMLLLVVLYAVAVVLRRSTAAVRHFVWSAGFAGLLMLPVLLALSARAPLAIQLPWSWRRTTDAAAVSARPSDAMPADRAPTPSPNENASALPSTSERRPSNELISVSVSVPASTRIGAAIRNNLGTILLIVWLTGVFALLARLVSSVRSARALATRALPVIEPEWLTLFAALKGRAGVKIPVELLESDETSMPFAFGIRKHAIILPMNANAWTPACRETVLLHELAHVARRDLLFTLIAQTASALHWMNPLAWHAARRMRLESEHACDDLVLRQGTLPSDYSEHLLGILRSVSQTTGPALTLAAARPSEFEGRLLAILAPGVRRHSLSMATALAIALGVLVTAVPLAAMRVSPPASTIAATQSRSSDPSDTDADSDDPHGVVEDAAAKEIVAAAHDEAQESPRPEQQQDRNSSAVTRELVRALGDQVPQVRLAAVQALGERSDRDAVQALNELLVRETTVSVRRAIITSMGQIDDPRSIAALLKALSEDDDAGVREAAANALGEIDDTRAVAGLVAALRAERVVSVKRRIVWALGELDDPSAVDGLGVALRDSDLEVRRQAIWALGEIEAESAVPLLLPFLRDNDVDTRRRTAAALAEIESPTAIDGLTAAARDADAEVRRNVIYALGAIENDRSLPTLLAALRDREVEVRRAAVSAIGDLDEMGRAPRELIDALGDEDAEVREHALHALSSIGDQAAVAAIVPLTRADQTPSIRRTATQALADIGGEDAVRALIELLKDPDAEVRKTAAQGLGNKR
jgi:HEAT repeat protein/beta-lactamase regulating signal transducer with metallopeptidase domain